MDIRVSSGTGYASPLKGGVRSGKSGRPSPLSTSNTDRVEISAEAKEKRQAVLAEDRFSQMETLADGPNKDALMAQIQDWRQSHQLEVNWNATVDPDGSIYAKSYVESLVCQYEGLRGTIEAYYQEGHQENLRFSNPHNHLVEKYKFSGSPYFRGDMTEAQRNMAFRQEEALLWGGRVALNDPWALAASGGVPQARDVEQTARDYAQSVIDEWIAMYKKANGIQE